MEDQEDYISEEVQKSFSMFLQTEGVVKKLIAFFIHGKTIFTATPKVFNAKRAFTFWVILLMIKN